MRDKAECPSTETLAAFADGGLRGRQRRAVTGHLADCDRCREVVSETVRFRAEEAEALPPSVAVFPVARRRLNTRLVLAAAALLAGAAWLGIHWLGPGPVPAPSTPSPLTASKPQAPTVKPAAPSPVPRVSPAIPPPAAPELAGFYAETLASLASGPAGGAGTGEAPDGNPGAAGFAFAGGISRDRAAARIGAGLASLALARRSGAARDVKRIREDLEPAVAALRNPASVREALDALSAEEDPTRLGARLDAVGRAVGPMEEPMCRLGFWVGGGMRAAAARDRSFFGPGFPDGIDANSVTSFLPPGAVKTLEDLRATLENGIESETEWRRLERQLRGLGTVLGFR